MITQVRRQKVNSASNPNVKWLVHIHMTHSFVSWLIHMWHDSSTHAICSFVYDMTHSYVTWLIRMWHDTFVCDMIHSYVTWLIRMWHDSFVCDMTHSYMTWLIRMWHDSFVRDVTIHICNKTHSCVTRQNNNSTHSTSRLPKNIGLFCKRALQKRLYSAKETYVLKESTNQVSDWF